MSIDRWMDKQNVVHPLNGMLRSLKKKWNSDPGHNMDEPWGHNVSERNQSQKDKYYITPLIWHSYGSQIHWERQQNGGCRGLSGEKWTVTCLMDKKSDLGKMNKFWRWMSSWYFVAVQMLSRVQLFATPWAAAHQASLPITNSRSFLKLMSIESVMASNHLILCRPLLLLPSIFPSIRISSSESILRIRWPKGECC